MKQVLRLVAGVAIAIAALLLIDWRALGPMIGEGLGRAVSPEILLTAGVGQLISLALCALGLFILSPRMRFFAAVASRWVRDAVGALPIGVPGVSEAAGMRLLALSGNGECALSWTAADILAETIAQVPYAAAAVLLAPPSVLALFAGACSSWSTIVCLIGAASVIIGAIAALAPGRLWPQVRDGAARIVGRLRSRRFALSVALHLAAWISGGVQVFVLVRMLGGELNLLHSVSLEGLVYALRAAFFFVPGGVGVQEAGLAGLAASFGLSPVEGVALAAILRLRDVVFGAPSLLIWSGLEGARLLKADRPISHLRRRHVSRTDSSPDDSAIKEPIASI